MHYEMRRRTFLRTLTAAAGAALSAPGAAAGAPGPAKRSWSSIVFAVFENHGFQEVAGLPSHRRLAAEGAILTRYSAVAHPSGPNYRALVSGETWGSSEIVDTFHPSFGSEAAQTAPAIPTYVYHLIGEIAARHNPFLDLHAPIAAVKHGTAALRRDLEGLLPSTAIVYVGWDDDNDMHNGDVRRADRNLSDLLDVLGASSWFSRPDAEGRYPVFFFCYDEDDGRESNNVFAAWWGRGVRHGFASAIPHDHYAFCRTVTDNFGLPPLGRAAGSLAIGEPW
jgi:phosphatidylinositol-3-phosphatase